MPDDPNEAEVRLFIFVVKATVTEADILEARIREWANQYQWHPSDWSVHNLFYGVFPDRRLPKP